MLRPRVTFSVGILLLAVAVVAINCWAFRRFYETDLYTVGKVGYRVLPASVGALPLFNVALISTWLSLAGRLRSPRHGRMERPRSVWPVVAFFSLHFLVLGTLVAFFNAESIRRIEVVVSAVTGHAAERWGALFGEPGGSVPWVVCESLILGVLVSGSPLIFAWAGQRLASRCAATLPAPRRRVMTGLVVLGFAASALAICLAPQPFEEEQEVVLDFQVIDEISGRPLAAAFVCVSDPFPHEPLSPPCRAFTDKDGRTRLVGRFLVSGESNAFRIFGSFSPWGRWLEVAAAGYPTLRVPLTQVLGVFADPTRPCTGKIKLAQHELGMAPLHDLAGTYLAGGHGFGGRWVQIESDGRFAWGEWGCVPPDFQEYGFLQRNGDEIEFLPVPHPGREIHPLVTRKHRLVRWGDRLYLSVADERELREFCRDALLPSSPSRSEDAYGPFLRQSDRDRPRTGLPRLPSNVWVGFLRDELGIHNEAGFLRLALGSRLARGLVRVAFHLRLAAHPSTGD